MSILHSRPHQGGLESRREPGGNHGGDLGGGGNARGCCIRAFHDRDRLDGGGRAPAMTGESEMLRTRRNFVAVAVSASLFTLSGASIAGEGSPHWSYTGPTGPAKWGALEEEYSSC